MTGTIHSNRLRIKNTLITGTTDNTGNLVLGTDYDSRCIVNVQTTVPLCLWALGTAGTSTNKMLHFWSFDGTTLANTNIAVRVFWIDESIVTDINI